MRQQVKGLDFKLQEMAARIRELREIEGLSQEQMAEETAQKARNAVACFGSGANYLTELVDITLERKH